MEEHSPPLITDDHLPALYRAANAASVSAQRAYLRLLRIDLVLLVCGAVLGSVDVHQASLLLAIRILAVAVLVASLVVTVTIRQGEWEQRWYGGRAAAESVKTLTWRYMTQAEPFDGAVAKETEGRFSEALRAVLAQREQLGGLRTGTLGAEPQITDSMRAVRTAPLATRIAIYRDQRIIDQRQWYSGKAAASAKAEGYLFSAVIGAQFLAVVAGILLVAKPEYPVNGLSVFATSAAALLAWLQVKRHQELAQSYDVTAQELGFIESQLAHITTESDFRQFVSDAESAISREHTLWVARRDRMWRGIPGT
jgi:hypothetical protein